ncbi:MAG TPA: UPF0182 family protein [Streptosporangiaceae bacterium]
MAFRSPGHSRPAGGRAIVLPRWPRYLIPAAAIVIAVIVIVAVVAGVWTDLLWFRSVGYSSVFETTYGIKWALFAVTALFMAAVTGVNMWLAYRLRPEYRPVAAEPQGLEAYRLVIDPHRRAALAVVLGLTALISGLTAAASWRTWLLFANRVPFGAKDPQFRLDISFYTFDFPFIRMVLSYLFAAVILSLLLSALVHYLYGGLRPQRKGSRATPRTRAHLFVLAGVFVLLKAVAYWVDRYGINFSSRGIVRTGASYTDVHAILPAKTVLAGIALICAALFFIGAIRRSSLLPAIGFGLLVLSAVIIGGVYPAIVQQFVVKPNQLTKETPYLSREITSTRQAYGITSSQVSSYTAISAESPSALAKQADALPDTRVLDQGVMSPSFQQLQQVKAYYQFANVLSMDRYVVKGSGQPQDMVVGVRDMSGPPPGQRNWVNSHLVYTHGYGFVAAPADTAQSGNPDFAESDIPPQGEIPVSKPEVYFGQQEAGYVIADTRQLELNYPQGTGQQNNHYLGGGGVPIGSALNRLLYTVKFRELNILLSGAIQNKSRLLYIRDPLARVSKVAPFLTLDANTYPVVAGGQTYWVVDGYTTSDNYPYSQRVSLDQATQNSYNPGGAVVGPDGQVNYLRNSVKALVNAYTGAVTLYQWTGQDPVLQDWMRAFPGVIKPRTDIPPAVLPHLRYPPDMFEVQRQILTQYHVTSASQFYGGQNFWQVPDDPSGLSPGRFAQPPYYLTMAGNSMPGLAKPEFSLTTALTPRGRANMSAFMAVDSNPQSPDYGQIRVLQLPQDTTIRGPGQVQNDFESNATVAKELTLLRGGGSTVTQGNLVTLPVGGGLVYFEPVYVSQVAAAGSSYPTVQLVLVYYNGQIGFATSLPAAIAQAFGTSGKAPVTGTSPPGGTPPPTTPSGPASAAVRHFLQQAESFYTQAQAALRAGDFAAYGRDLAKMNTALNQAIAAAGGSPAPSLSPSPPVSPSSPSVSPAPSPSPSG